MAYSFNSCAAVLAAALATPAGAQQTGPPAEPALAPSAGAIIVTPGVTAPTGWSAQQVAAALVGADTNRDGSLTRAEAQTITAVRLNFEALDANKDGALSRSEFENGLR